VDPQLEIEPYLEAAAQKSMRITHIFETHVQADHLSGARRLSEATGAPVIFHKSAPVAFPHVDVGDGERHELGNVSLSILHGTRPTASPSWSRTRPGLPNPGSS
jgi:glyoxylase-like metal-dependent hydrolase (beta-lactamase superfamily II)